MHHKKICKHYNAFVVSWKYQALTTHDKVDALLLSQLVADPDIWRTSPSSDPVSSFLDLIKVPRPDGFVPPLCLSKGVHTTDTVALAEDLYARFSNNNFVLHSHLDSYAHGVFPLASRYFNHSCVPNAVCKYVITPLELVRMEVVVLRDINEREEVTIPYLDPALPFQTRQDALRVNYGFECACSLCAFGRRVEPVPKPPTQGSAELRALEDVLRSFSLGDVSQGQGMRVPAAPGAFERLPKELHCVLHESYLPFLSEAFSKASHEGPYGDAVERGLTLLAFYAMIYPPSYPQIGMHTLELAKTLWNVICTDVGAVTGADEGQLKGHARAALNFAAVGLRNFGPEGDLGGPLEEVRVLAGLLQP
ncbi:transcription factor [Ganoderma sinense ZZ0214-1]|uniref:Transcription factor n=1 Tax=Ganoderma sinense ZZ0214-1 TaxID=1077348 RepID=A0A2G8RME5_9APHY|nr:transcription factor [Ganoderma sinense ZZ0214-1]